MENLNKRVKLLQGDNMVSFKKLPDNSIDSVITDGPYGLSFMGKKWDYDVPSVQFWKEVYRVLKPGGHILSFGGTRTYHRMTVNIEDAGFEIRDQIMWLYGSGFPKSRNIGKDIEKINVGGLSNLKQIGTKKGTVATNHHELATKDKPKGFSYKTASHTLSHSEVATARTQTTGDIPVYEINNEYDGWGTALKPANEPICVARKPLSEKSVAENVLRWGTGGINVDGCRIGNETIKSNGYYNQDDTGVMKMGISKKSKEEYNGNEHQGRFPANIILECCCDEVIKGESGEIKKTTRDRKYEVDDEKFKGLGTRIEAIDNYNDKGDIHTNPMCPCFIMDEQSGNVKGGKNMEPFMSEAHNDIKMNSSKVINRKGYGDKGGASRFFYQAKVSKAERNMGLDGFEDKEKIKILLNRKCVACNNWENKGAGNGIDYCKCDEPNFVDLTIKTSKNNHPTVKPVSLMAYLCRLITPSNGIVLDPFMGSGSTGISALLEGFRFVGMEMDKDYFKIAESRIENYEQYRKFIKK
jgi:site-specific DNA-methyltransferase (adenine-specific)